MYKLGRLFGSMSLPSAVRFYQKYWKLSFVNFFAFGEISLTKNKQKKT